jgi:hypothetical protein
MSGVFYKQLVRLQQKVNPDIDRDKIFTLILRP